MNELWNRFSRFYFIHEISIKICIIKNMYPGYIFLKTYILIDISRMKSNLKNLLYSSLKNVYTRYLMSSKPIYYYNWMRDTVYRVNIFQDSMIIWVFFIKKKLKNISWKSFSHPYDTISIENSSRNLGVPIWIWVGERIYIIWTLVIFYNNVNFLISYRLNNTIQYIT